ncbi:hypothetical protein STEG23_002436, partial [Scotinomys teguina]
MALQLQELPTLAEDSSSIPTPRTGKWKDLENIILNEETQTQKDKHVCIQNKKLHCDIVMYKQHGTLLTFALQSPLASMSHVSLGHMLQLELYG